ncbi:Ubiquinone biosynthesis protein coq9, mitochondrial [Wickerhamiella sorbophila]|uniref:Ubiquinone biosynthesis protein n=1 Tax=Wickerhamiella sorbophila TaxID=45607 RepID=A0A2T0FDM1_9ASCO|nr:Ubiquinone biosynthesis protein coq9, mitochondrial [Wickerhamiella sorbophila]PRT53103.1 Ubiquinone biosynthesis protein coq9, mitochondrial [Wickerhamiella sorbophila]
MIRASPRFFTVRTVQASLRSYATAHTSKSEVDLPRQILERGLQLLPEHGWDLAPATRSLGLSDQAASIFPNGKFDLLQFYLQKQTAKLASVQLKSSTPDGCVRELVHARLLANAELGPYLGEAVSMLMSPKYLPYSLEQLHNLVDEIWFLAGDKGHDATWYTRRGSLAMIYAASESFMTRDNSPNFKHTLSFCDRQLNAWSRFEAAEESVSEWFKFNAIAAFNVAKSLTR